MKPIDITDFSVSRIHETALHVQFSAKDMTPAEALSLLTALRAGGWGATAVAYATIAPLHVAPVAADPPPVTVATPAPAATAPATIPSPSPSRARAGKAANGAATAPPSATKEAEKPPAAPVATPEAPKAVAAPVAAAHTNGAAVLPDLSSPRVRMMLMQLAVDQKLIEQDQVFEDPKAAWITLQRAAPAGWFKTHAPPASDADVADVKDAPKDAPAAAKATAAVEATVEAAGGWDLAGTAAGDDEPAAAAPAANAGPYDLAYLSQQTRILDVINHVTKKTKVASIADLIAICEGLKPEVPVLKRALDLAVRITRTCESYQIEFGE